MLDVVKALISRQFDAALCTLDLCIRRCPDANWNAPVANLKFCQAALHTLIFTDLYLSKTEDQTALKAQPFHVEHAAVFRDYEEFEDRAQVLTYERPFILDYVQHCKGKGEQVFASETAETLAGPSGFSWRKCPRAELHVYNTRHIQHHAAQLSLRLRLDAGIDIPWVSHGWKQA